MELVLEIAGDQIDGARDYQEDAFLITYLDDDVGDSKSSALVIMADGMGGHAAGNIASNLVVSTFNKSFTGGFGREEAPITLRGSLEKANDALRESIKETPALDGMGCTMVTAAITKSRVFWVSVGDSHLYIIRDHELFKKNEDHSYGGYLDRMKEQGMEVEAEAGLSRNMLMSAMTGDEIPEIDCPSKGFQLLPGDRVVVASDGLDTLSQGTILQTSLWSSSAKECVQALLAAVDEAKKPRQDNTTVIVCDVAQRDAPPVAPPAPTSGGMGDTQPMDTVALNNDLARERDSAVVLPEPEEEPVRGGKGKVVAIAVVLLAAVGAGAWYMLGGQSAPPPSVFPDPQPPTVATTPDPTPAGGGQSASTGEPSGGEVIASGTEPTAEDPQTTEPETAPPGSAAPAEFRDKLRSGGEGPTMVSVPAGTFEMGSSGLSVKADERPRHEVDVPAFAIGKYEITFAEYERFARATGRKRPDSGSLDKDTHAAFLVSWDDAYAYTQWLSEQTGERYRLPSEAEWEYAASTGKSSPFAWGFEIGENNAHCFDCGTGLNPRQTTRVGRFPANDFGLHDAAGNVAEWVHDCYHPNYEGAPGDGGVWEGGDCSNRVVRGGAYTNTAQSIRPASREKYPSQRGYDSIGFRVARDL